jgi:hypothetical protein
MNRSILAIALSGALCCSFVPSGAEAAPPQMRPTEIQYQRFKFLKYSTEYPKTYIPQPLQPRDPGGYFLRTAPFGFLFTMMARQGEDSIQLQGRALADAMLRRLGRRHGIKSSTVTDIPADRLPPRTDLGKALDAVTGQGLKMHAEFYRTEIDGRKVLVGFATLTADRVPNDLRHLITTDQSSVSDAFLHMVETLRVER